MDSLYNSFYNFVSSSVVPTVTAGATQLADGAAQVLNSVSQTALDWTSGSEDVIGSSEVFSWEQMRNEQQPVSQDPSTSSAATEPPPQDVEEKLNTTAEWEIVKEHPDVTGPKIDPNHFEVVQNDYKWMKEN